VKPRNLGGYIMWQANVFLTVLFPILIAVGLALGMDASTSIEFSLARWAFGLAAAIPFVLAFSTFRDSDLTLTSVGVLCVTVGIIAGSFVLGFTWLDLKENIYCYTMPAWTQGDHGPYTLVLFNDGIYPAANVRVSMRAIDEPYDLKYVEIGDVEPQSVLRLDKLPAIGPGTYQIDLRMRSGKFQELLWFERSGANLSIKYTLYRITIHGNEVIKTIIRDSPTS
jgi:hypothetical protein